MGTNTFLFAECWTAHSRPLNSTEPRDSSVPEIPGGKTLTITILDDNGKPIPQAKFGYLGDPKPHSQKDRWHYVETDDKGQFVIRFKPDTVQKTLQIEVDNPGFAPYNATWEAPQTDPIPEAYTIQLEKAVQIGGIVLGENGKPYPGADVTFRIHWQHRSRTPQICSYGVWAQTDENGVWTCNLAPPKMLDVGVHFNVKVKGYIPLELISTPLSSFLPDENGNFKHVVKLDRGLTVQGRITDEDGKPIADAVVFGNYMETRDDFTTKTNENGEFSIPNLPETDERYRTGMYVGVWAPGKMSTIQDFTLKKDNVPTLNIAMKKAGKPIKIKIIDEKGNPVPKFYICIERWGKHRLVNEILLTGKPQRAQTGEDGTWTWKEAPENEIIFDMFGASRMDVRKKNMTARDEEYVFTAPPPLEVSGKVLDAETGEPIPTFKVYLGFGSENSSSMHWELKPNSGKDGSYLVGETYPRPCFGVKIEPEGYENAISREIAPDEGQITIDFKIQKLSTEKLADVLKGTVLTPDGKAATQAKVALTTQSNHVVWIRNNNVRLEEPYVIATDSDGKFQFAYFDFEKEGQSNQMRSMLRPGETPDQYAIFIFDDSGFRRVSQKEMESTYKTEPIPLQRWGTVQGTVKFGTRLAKEEMILYRPVFKQDESYDQLSPVFDYSTKSDAQGHFSFQRIPPGKGWVSRYTSHSSGRMSIAADTVKVDIPPGESTTVNFGGVGRPITGKLVLGEGIKEDIANDRIANRDSANQMPSMALITNDTENGGGPQDVRIECSPAVEPLPKDIGKKMRDLLPKEFFAEPDMTKRQTLIKEWTETTEEGKEFKKLGDQQTAYYQKRSDNRFLTRRAFAKKDGTFCVENVPEGDWELEGILESASLRGGKALGKVNHRFTVPNIPGGVSDEPLDIGTLTVERIEQPKPLLQVGRTAPDFELPQIHPITEDSAEDSDEKKKPEATKLKLSDYRGKYVILDFWATWCGPCLVKMPELQKFYRSIEGDPKFVMIAISLDSSDETEMVSKFVAKQEMPWLHALAGNWNSSPMLKDYGVSSIPALLLIDKDGKVILSNPKVEELKRKVDELK